MEIQNRRKPSAFNEVGQKEISETLKPFVIRGHHLRNFTRLLSWEKIDMSNYRNYYANPAEEVAMYDVKGIWETEDPEYTKDVYGNTAEGLEKNIQDRVNVYEKFLKLPDTYPVQIVEEQIDELCKTCAIGNHCRQFSSRSTDPQHLDAFLSKAKNLGKEKDLQISEQVVTFIDAEPGVGRQISITAGQIRDILRAFLPGNARSDDTRTT